MTTEDTHFTVGKTTFCQGEHGTHPLFRIEPGIPCRDAADLLKVSHSHLIKLLDEFVIPHTKTGRHRRVKLADLVAYKDKRDEVSRSAMDALAAQAQELRMGYE